MASKAQINNVTVDLKFNTAYVYYDSGSERMFPADKLPKTVAKWLAEHETVDSITSVNPHDDGSLVVHYATGTEKIYESLDDLPKEVKAWVNTNGFSYNETVEEEPEVKEDPEYSDVYDRPTTLTADELNWFHSVVEKAKAATGCTVEIIAYNHDRYKGTSSEALGCCITNDPENPIDGGYITIDTYFIHEMYEVKFNGGFNLCFDTLEHVIAHEIAHLTEWNHSEAHTELTEKLYQLIVAPEADDQEVAQNDQENAQIESESDQVELVSAQTHREPVRRGHTPQPKSLALDIVDAVVNGLLMASHLSLIALAYLMMGLASTCQAMGAAMEWLTPRAASLIDIGRAVWTDTVRPAGKAAAVWMAEAVWFILI